MLIKGEEVKLASSSWLNAFAGSQKYQMTVQWLSLLASPGDTNEFILDEKAPFISSEIILDGGEIAWSEAS